jgi:DNA polymerase-3 subunit gamma/tau
LSYLVLARKWRPSTFEEVVGQAHVTRTLANAVESGRVGHAYLFSGPRGVGKTTTARLLAKSLNCPNAKGAVPCNDCDFCREITAGVSFDVIEIDAASNRGIDEIRNLRENVKYAPAGGKYKVYVVDEVHMLTDPAFNALLKTLEEPPPHVKFILATTAPLKVPETILSRCQRFEFVRIPTRDVFARLKLICSKEGFEVRDEVLMLLSRRANGSLRDAESMLDQLISAGLEGAEEPDVAQLLGASGAEVFFSVIDAVKAKDARKALEALGKIFDRGANLDEFTDGLMVHLRNLLLIKIHPDLASLVEASSGHVKRYEEQATQFSEGDILRLINIASRASYSVQRSALPRLHLEMAIVEMSYLDSTTQLSELIEKLEGLEAKLADRADTREQRNGSGRAETSGQRDSSGRAAMRSAGGETDSTESASAETQRVKRAATKPAETTRAEAEPDEVEPARSTRAEAVPSEIGRAESSGIEPIESARDQAELTETKSAKASRAETVRGKVEPNKTEPVRTDRVEAQVPGMAVPVRTDRVEAQVPGMAVPARTDRVEAQVPDTNGPEIGRTEMNQMDQAETHKAETNRTERPAESATPPVKITTESVMRPEKAPTQSVIRPEKVTTESLEKWNQVLSKITARKKSLGVCLSPARFRGISQGKVILGFREDKSFEQSIVEQKVNKKILQEELTAVFKATLGVSCVRIESDSEEAAEEVSAPGADNGNARSTPDDSLKTILEYFDGEIIED